MALDIEHIAFFDRGTGRTWEIGDIRIAKRDDRYVVGMYLPHLNRKLFNADYTEQYSVVPTRAEADAVFNLWVERAREAGWRHDMDWMLIEGERTWAKYGAHTCHDGVEHEVNACDICDRCGEEVKEKGRRHG